MAKGQKKKAFVVFTVILLLCVIVVVAYFVLNNRNEKPKHTHEYSTEYKYNEETHWFECECGAKEQVEKHSLVKGVCKCDYEEKGIVHTHGFDRKTVKDEYLKSKATCENKAVYYYSCKCGEKGEETFEYGNPLGHSFSNYKDNGDGTKTAECDNGCGKANTIEKGHVHNYSSVIVPPTCEEKGYTIYTCDCGDTYRADEVKELGHNYGDFISDDDGIHHTKTCKKDSDHKVTKNCGGGTATCIKKAKCSVCGGEYGGYVNHDYSNLKYNDDYHWFECACGDKTEFVAHKGGSATCTNKAVCTICGQQYGELGDHAYGSGASNDNGTHTKTCANDNSHKLTENCTDNGNGICAYCGATLEKLYIRAGDKIYFGLYPQTKVTDGSLNTTLNNLAGTLPTSNNNRNWTSYGYYIKNNVENYMWYIDVTSGGEKYRGVYFTLYRPKWTNYSTSTDSSYQDDNGYRVGGVYWFKYEQIEWRILSESGGKALIMANLIIDSQSYQDKYYYDDVTHKYYTSIGGLCANNYKYSTIRSWLNDNFYNTAFSELEQKLINTVVVNNGVESTGYYDDDFSYEYSCENTEDKVFLLSYKEATNIAYGFSNSGNYTDMDEARQLKVTDYAQSQGCHADIYTSDNYFGCGSWWLRSPDCYNTYMVKEVSWTGGAEWKEDFYSTSIGVVPVLQIQLD